MSGGCLVWVAVSSGWLTGFGYTLRAQLKHLCESFGGVNSLKIQPIKWPDFKTGGLNSKSAGKVIIKIREKFVLTKVWRWG